MPARRRGLTVLVQLLLWTLLYGVWWWWMTTTTAAASPPRHLLLSHNNNNSPSKAAYDPDDESSHGGGVFSDISSSRQEQQRRRRRRRTSPPSSSPPPPSPPPSHRDDDTSNPNNPSSSLPPPLPLSRYIVVGERNSGTNYVDRLIRDNIPGMRALSGCSGPGPAAAAQQHHDKSPRRRGFWKHDLLLQSTLAEAYDDLLLKRTAVIFVHKDPYSWLLSMRARPYHSTNLRVAPLDEFVEAKWHARVNHCGRMIDEQYESVMALRTAKLRAALSLRDRQTTTTPAVVFVKYEEVLANPAGAIRSLALALGKPLAEEFTDATLKLQGNNVGRVGNNFTKRKFYLEREYLAEFWRDSASMSFSGQTKTLTAAVARFESSDGGGRRHSRRDGVVPLCSAVAAEEEGDDWRLLCDVVAAGLDPAIEREFGYTAEPLMDPASTPWFFVRPAG